jgi:hypothetical protein
MKHLKKFNEHNDLGTSLDISGLKCDNPDCGYSDMSVPLSDYKDSIGKACPECGESLLTQDDYDQVMQMVQAVEVINSYSSEDIDKILANLSEDEINGALDMMNKLKMKKVGDNGDGTETWSIGEKMIYEALSNSDRYDKLIDFLSEKDFELYDGEGDLEDFFMSISSDNLSPEQKAEEVTRFLEDKWGLYDGYLEVLNFLKNIFNK